MVQHSDDGGARSRSAEADNGAVTIDGGNKDGAGRKGLRLISCSSIIRPVSTRWPDRPDESVSFHEERAILVWQPETEVKPHQKTDRTIKKYIG